MENKMKQPDQTEQIILKIMDLIMQLSAINPRMLTRENDYGGGEVHTGLEMHTLRYIVDNPGCTVTEIAETWSRTVGAISQVVKKLRNEGMVSQRKDPSNERRNLLYATGSGISADSSQRTRELERAGQAVQRLKGYTDEELMTTSKILRELIQSKPERYSKVQKERIK